jgi:Restriction endonuclease
MEQVQRIVIVACPSCGQQNRVADRSGLPSCGICHAPLPPVPPMRPARPFWTALVGFLCFCWQAPRLPGLSEYWRHWRQDTQAHQRYVAADRRFRLLEEERQRKVEEERHAREDWIAMHKRLQCDQLDHLTGREFEQRLATLFRHQGYSVKLTKGSGDQGADLLLSHGTVRIAVQAKRYTARVGNSAIQELLGG